MASQVEIAKIALSHFGDRYDIASITESSTEAEAVNLVFEPAVRFVLRKHNWKFAKAWICPAALAAPLDAAGDVDVPANWGYMFTYPPDAVKIHKIVNPLGDREDPIRYDIGLNSAGAKVILCNEETPEIQYTKYISDPTFYDDMFVTTLSYYIAHLICMNLTGDPGLAQGMFQLYRGALAEAAAEDGSEGVEEVHPEAEWIKARA